MLHRLLHANASRAALMALLFLLALAPAYAQWDVGVSGAVGLTLGPSSLTENFGMPMGGSLWLRYSLRERLRLAASVGYWQLAYTGPAVTAAGWDVPQLGLAPLFVGGEYVFMPVTSTRRFEAYAGLELGYLLLRETQDQAGERQRLGSTGALALAPYVGLRLPLTDALQLDARLQPLYALTASDVASVAYADGGATLAALIHVGVCWRIQPDAHPRYRPRTRRQPRKR